MSTLNTIRAWKDEDYRLGLSQNDRDLLPAHPAGATELSDDQLFLISGGVNSAGQCPNSAVVVAAAAAWARL